MSEEKCKILNRILLEAEDMLIAKLANGGGEEMASDELTSFALQTHEIAEMVLNSEQVSEQEIDSKIQRVIDIWPTIRNNIH